jgi:hypothetical protein
MMVGGIGVDGGGGVHAYNVFFDLEKSSRFSTIT